MQEHTSISFLLKFALSICLCLSLNVQGQTPEVLTKPLNALNEFNSRFPQEKVYLHTDRKHYAPGESIWFQAYVLAGYYHELSPMSNNLYVGLYSSDKSMIGQLLVRVDFGAGIGVIDIPEDLASGSYVLRAYTNWMKNFDQAYFFEKELVILGQESEVGPASSEVFDIDLQFFPEGGHLVDQVASRVAFKAIDHTGRAISVSGSLYDDTGAEVTQFETSHSGMGILALTPSKDRSYTAKIDSNGKSYNLPPIESTGYSISVNNNIADVLRITLRSNESTKGKDKLGVIMHTRGAISYAFDVDVSKNYAFVNLPKANIPEGISHITLFDAKGRPLLERLVYMEKPRGILTLKTDKPAYTKREKVSTTIEVRDQNGEPVSGVFSLSAIDLGQSIDSAPQNTLVSELLLTSDLKGFIENPMYYFDTANPDRKKQLDMVMLTHGWSRFEWSELEKQNKFVPDHPVEQGLTVRGRLMKLGGKKPAEGGKITLVNHKSTPPTFLEAEADQNGQFAFNNTLLFDSEEVLFQGVNKKGRNFVQFELDTLLKVDLPDQFYTSLESEKTDISALQRFNEKSKRRDLIDEAYNFDSTATDLGTVVVEGNRLAIKEEKERRSAYGKGDNTLRFGDDDVISATNPLELIQGKLAGVYVTGTGTQMQVNIRGSVAGAGNALPPLILIDDVPTDIAGITSLPANFIERVEVFKGPSAAIFGVRGGGGVLAFYTKTGDNIPSLKRPNGIYVTQLRNSYHLPRTFYAPKYDVQKPEHIKPDSRILLHWEPLILLDENGMATVEFWSSDEETEVLIDLQGITKTGTPYATTLTYNTGQ